MEINVHVVALGCVEAEASSWSLVDQLSNHSNLSSSKMANQEPNFESLFQCAAQGDELSLSLRNKCLEVWAAGVINLIHAYDPEILIMGGGVLKSADVIIPFMSEQS